MGDIFTLFYLNMHLTLNGLASDTWISTVEGKKINIFSFYEKLLDILNLESC